MLLLKCKDAIETLHLELEAERTDKQQLGEELSEVHRALQEMREQDNEKNYRMQRLAEENV